MAKRHSPAKLIDACMAKHYVKVRWLLRERHDPNLPHDETLALHIAAEGLDVELAALLMSYGADPELSAVPGGPTAHDIALSLHARSGSAGAEHVNTSVAPLIQGCSPEKIKSLARENKQLNRFLIMLRIFDDGAKSTECAAIVEAFDTQLDALEVAGRSSSRQSAWIRLLILLVLTLLFFSGVVTSRLEKAGENDTREL